MSDEHKFQDKMVDWLRNNTRAYVHCQTASMMNAGQPDLCIHTPNGYSFFVENKYWRNQGLPKDFHAIQALLRGPQVNVIKHQLWKRGVFCPIIAQIALKPEVAAVCFKDQIVFTPWKEFLERIVNHAHTTEKAVDIFSFYANKQKDK